MSDHSEPTSDLLVAVSNEESSPRPRSRDRFPIKLFHAVSNSPDNILEWSRNGGAFCIHSVEAMENVIMPQYFPKTKRYPSLVRKFNRWGFRRSRCEAPFFQDKQIVFVHPKFHRDDPDRLHSMVYEDKGGKKEEGEESSQSTASQRHNEALASSLRIPQIPVVSVAEGQSVIRDIVDAQPSLPDRSFEFPPYSLGNTPNVGSLLQPNAQARPSSDLLELLAAQQRLQTTNPLSALLDPSLQAQSRSLPYLPSLEGGLLPVGGSSTLTGSSLPPPGPQNNLSSLDRATLLRLLASTELEQQRLLLLHYLRDRGG